MLVLQVLHMTTIHALASLKEEIVLMLRYFDLAFKIEPQVCIVAFLFMEELTSSPGLPLPLYLSITWEG